MLWSLFCPLSNIQRLTYIKKKWAIRDCLKFAFFFLVASRGRLVSFTRSKACYKRKAHSDALLDVKCLCSVTSALGSGCTDTFDLHHDSIKLQLQQCSLNCLAFSCFYSLASCVQNVLNSRKLSSDTFFIPLAFLTLERYEVFFRTLDISS